MTENSNFDFEKLRKSILEDSSTSDKQKEVLLKELAKKVIPPETKVLDIKISNEIPQKTKDDVELAERTREMLRLRFTEYGLDCPKMDTLSDMDVASSILKALKQRNTSNETPSGSAPLNDAQLGKSSGNQGFETPEAMVADLYTRKDPESKEVLDAIWAKAYKGFKDKKYGEQEIIAPEDFLQKCVKKSDEYKKWLDENRRGA